MKEDLHTTQRKFLLLSVTLLAWESFWLSSIAHFPEMNGFLPINKILPSNAPSLIRICADCCWLVVKNTPDSR